MKKAFLKPLSRAVLIGMWILLLITSPLLAEQTWVVGEVFSTTTCGFCPAARSALNQMNNNEEDFPFLIPIIWQGNGPHQSPNFNTRAQLYQVAGIPHARFNGNVRVVGGGAGVLDAYTNAYNAVEPRQAPMTIFVNTEVNDQGQLAVAADITMLEDINTPNNHVVMVLTYDLTGTMDPDYFASAKAYHQTAFNLDEAGEETTVNHNFNLDDNWDIDRVKVAVMVQSLTIQNPEVHQAGIGFVGQYQPFDVTGTVVNTDEQGVGNATVRLQGRGLEFTTNTAANGSFSLDDVFGNEGGINYNMTITHEDYETHRDNITVYAQNLNLGNIEIHETTLATVTGRVISPDQPEGLVDATVELYRDGADYQTQSRADGSFTIENVATTQEGIDFNLYVHKFGYTDHRSSPNIGGTQENLGNIEIQSVPYRVPFVYADVDDDEEEDQVNLRWLTPQPGTPQWAHYDSGENNTGVGTGQAAQMHAAIRFSPEEIEELDLGGLYVTNFRFFPTGQGATYTVKIWRGGTMTPAINPGQVVYQETLRNVTVGQWNEVAIEDPPQIPEDQEIWIGYHVNTPGGHPLGADNGPLEHDGFSNLLEIGGNWTTLTQVSQPPMQRNWNIQAYANFYDPGDRGRGIAMNPDGVEFTTKFESHTNIDHEFNHTVNIGDIPEFTEAVVPHTGETTASTRPFTRRADRRANVSNLNRNLEGYNVYRLRPDDQNDPGEWTFLTMSEDTSHVDTDWGLDLEPGEFQWAVTAVYAGEVESDPAFSNSLWNRMQADVHVSLTSNSGDPVEGAQVRLRNVDTDDEYIDNVDEDGEVIIRRVLHGNYDIRIMLSGFDTIREDNLPIQGDNVELDYELIESLDPVVGLDHELYEDNNVRLEWYAPGTVLAEPQWMHWDTGNNTNAIGTNSPIQFMVASRFTPENIEELNVAGLYINSIRFWPHEGDATYTVKVWTGGSASPLNPGEEVHSQAAANVQAGQWNEVQLDESVRIEPDQEIWFGYHIDTPGGTPAGVDGGPHTNEYGNIMFFNNAWTVLTALNQDLTYNWNLQAYAGSEEGESRVVSRSRLGKDRTADSANNRALLGYKIMRDDEVLETEFEGLVYNDTDLEPGNYMYSVIAQYTTGESDPERTEAIILSVEDEDYITPLITELRGNYPNPFNPETTINFALANDDYVKIDIFNVKGQKVRTLVDEKLESGVYNVVWDGINNRGQHAGSGIFFYRMESSEFSTTKKMILMK